MQPWRLDPDDGVRPSGSGAQAFWPPLPYAVGVVGRTGSDAASAAASGLEAGPCGVPWLSSSRIATASSLPRGQQLASYAALPSAATVGDDDDGDTGSDRGHGHGKQALEQGGGPGGGGKERSGSGASSHVASDRRGSSTTTIPEIASDAALAELRARIREDTLACRQVRDKLTTPGHWRVFHHTRHFLTHSTPFLPVRG
jgi:hypothetical protein